MACKNREGKESLTTHDFGDVGEMRENAASSPNSHL